MLTIINLAHHATNRVASISTALRVVMQGDDDGYWKAVSHDHSTITHEAMIDAVEVLKTMGWVFVTD
jgi:hypothetical protein